MPDLQLRTQSLEWRDVGDEVVALDTDVASYLGANRAGAILWKALAAGTTRDQLIKLLTDEFGIDEPTAAEDVDRFLAQLRLQNLLEEQ